MPSPIPSKDLLGAKLMPIEKQLPIQRLKEELDFLEQELLFYQQLLHIGLDNGSKRIQPELIHLLEDLKPFVQIVLPGMHRLIKSVNADTNKPNESFGSFRQELETLKQSLKHIKKQVFPIIAEFRSITIW